MAHPVAVATARAVAESRLARAASKLSAAFGVPLRPGTLPANRYPDLAAASLIDRVAEFLEQIHLKVQHERSTQQAADAPDPRGVLGGHEQADRGESQRGEESYAGPTRTARRR
jgi:hypothetical protein